MEKTILTIEERRARRELKREKQRAESVVRADKMHEARLVWEQEHSTTRLPQQSESNVTRMKFHVGCSGWFYWHWKSDFYPETLATKDWFPHYAAAFRTVELNASFYSWPTVATVESWLRQAGSRRFIYTVKARK